MDGQPTDAMIREIATLVEKLASGDATSESELDALIEQLVSLVHHPAPTDLIFHSAQNKAPHELALELLKYRPTPMKYTP